MPEIRNSEISIQKTKEKFKIYSVVGIISLLIVSLATFFFYTDLIRQQQSIQKLNSSLNNQQQILDDIATESEKLDEFLAPKEEQVLLSNFTILLKRLKIEYKVFQEEMRNLKRYSASSLEVNLKNIDLENKIEDYLKRVQAIIDNEGVDPSETHSQIKYLNFNSRDGLNDSIELVHTSTLQLGKRGLTQIRNLGIFVVLFCFGQIVLSWLLFFAPIYSTMLNQHENLKKAAIKAEESSKAKENFLANISHEIRTPMTSILGYAENLKTSFSSDDKGANRAIEIVNRNAQHLLSLIDELLDHSKIEAGEFDVSLHYVELQQFLSEIYSTLNVKAREKSLELSFQNETKFPQIIQTDPVRLRQIIINLIGNAIKFTEEGFVRLNLLYDFNKEELIIQVKDTGIGIPEDEQELIFSPFQQADSSGSRKYGGTGLGLSLSKKIANKMNGDIKLLSSRPNIGSTFELKIKSKIKSNTKIMDQLSMSIQIEQPERSISGDELKDKSILVVDDAKENARLFKIYLQQAGASVELAYSGLEAIDKSKSDDFHIILLDLQMPEKDGFETLKELRELGFNNPIVALTAHGLQEHKNQTLDAGFDGHITKPIQSLQLIDTIKKYS